MKAFDKIEDTIEAFLIGLLMFIIGVAYEAPRYIVVIMILLGLILIKLIHIKRVMRK